MLTYQVHLRARELSRNSPRRNLGKLEENELEELRPSVDKLPGICRAIHSGDPNQEFIGCQLVRRMISSGLNLNPPLEAVVKSGILPKCIELLNCSSKETQFEAAWIVINIAAGASRYVKHIVGLGVVDALVNLLQSEHLDVVEQAVWALGNIVGDGPQTRDLVIKTEHAVPRLVHLALSRSCQSSLLHNLSWALTNFFRRIKGPVRRTRMKMKAVRQILPALAHLISLNNTDGNYFYYTSQIIAEAALGLSVLTWWAREVVEDVLNVSSLSDRLVHLLNLPESTSTASCLRTLGNIIASSEEHANRILGTGQIVQILARLFQSRGFAVVKEATWTASAIAAAGPTQVTRLVDGGLVPKLIEVALTHDREPKKDAVFAITNITNSCTEDQIGQLCESGVIPVICSAFQCKCKVCKDRVILAMQALGRILVVAAADGDGNGNGEKLRKYRAAVVECGGLASLEQLQTEHDKHEMKRKNNDIYKVATLIMDTFFGKEEENDDASTDEDVKAAKLQKLDD